MAKVDKRGHSTRGDKYAKTFLRTMTSEAWFALNPYAQRLYPWLLLEWDGAKENNNGDIRLSVRQAADLLGCCRTTACGAFTDLQAKGFLVVHSPAVLGVDGEVCGNCYELTELALPPGAFSRARKMDSERKGLPVPKNDSEPHHILPRRLYLQWKPGRDFPVIRANVNNPRGVGGRPKKQNPILSHRTGPVLPHGTPCPMAWDGIADFGPSPVLRDRTPLITRGCGGKNAAGAPRAWTAPRLVIVDLPNHEHPAMEASDDD